MNAECCPTCHRKLPAPKAVRLQRCWACDEVFEQPGQGRGRLVCHKPECGIKRRTYRKQGFAALDRIRDS